MAGNASIVVDIKAQITGYEELIAKIKQSMKLIDPGSIIGKSLAKNLELADRKLTELTRKAESRISSLMQLNNLYDQLHLMDDLMKNLGLGMQNVGMDDVLATASDKAKELGQLIRETQNLMKTLGSTFFDLLEKGAHSDAFAKVKEQLNFDPKSMGIELFVSGVEQAIKSAKSNIKDLELELESALNKLDSMRLLQNARNALPANMQMGKPKADAVMDYLQMGSLLNKLNEQASRAEVVLSFLTLLQAGLAGDKSHTDEEKGNIGNMISNIAQDLMNAKDLKEIENVLQSLLTALTKGTHFAASRGIGSLTSSSMSEWSLKFLESYALTEEFKTKVGEIQQLVENTPIGQLGLIAQRLNELLLPGDAELFSERLTNLITVIQLSMQLLNNEVNRMDINKQLSVVDALGNRITAQKLEVQSLLDISGTKEYLELLTRVNLFELDITQLKQLLNLETDKNARETAANINKAGENVNKLLPTINEKNISDLKLYGSMLENVQARSLMVGKVEGIALRWFSVYAAVRMVGKAFRAVKDNVTNLDKTMTEIAIVTDKSLSDLWGQMPEYTAMARKYGASLLGVYEVSLLYYQQGLEQNDVMALTEQTLKMARISGLDYTEATNYMTNAIRSFKIEMQDSLRVVDVYSALAASSASSTSELATAMSKTASSAAAVGSSFENTSAMMAVMIETTRESPENIGSALKSIISRYGELKENKTGIDEEGEEYSLNKVDTALLSVGISIHDAKGEFRDFDDVITELSGKWDTIDKNTQRYIATVMAGNRQQSRFLALVSNGERLAELSETAANSEDAATLQVLKTMDSIDYKSQQLLTTLQSLYTSTGVETFYKGILDGANQLVKTFTDMPTLFNLPIPAIMSVATNFISMANIVMTGLSVLKTKFTSLWNLDDAARKMKRLAENTEEIELFRAKEQEKTKIQLQEGAKRELANTLELTAKTKTMNAGSLWALGAQVLGTGMNLAAGLISDKGRDNRAAKAGLGIGGSILQYGALGYLLSMGNPYATAAGAALGGLMGLWLNISYIWESTADLAKRMKDEAQEALTTYKLKNATAKNIEQEIAAVKKLKDALYDSAEAREKYIEASNKLAEDMPELVSHYDEEGNAIIELSNAYELLTNKRKEANEAATESADASIEAARKATEAAEENVATTGKDRWNKAFDFNKLSKELLLLMNQALGNLALEEGYIDTTELNRIRLGTGTLSGLANHVRDHEALLGEGYRYINGFLYNLASNPEALIGDMLGEESLTFLDNYTSEIQLLKDSGQESLATVLEFLVNLTQDALPALKAASGDLAGAQASENAVIRSQVADSVNRYRLALSDIVNYSTDQSAVAKAKEKLDLFTELTNAGEVATSFIMLNFLNGEYNTWKEFEEDTENGLQYSMDKALELLLAIPLNLREAVNDLFKDRDKYTLNQFKARLHKIIGDEDLSTTNAIMDAQTSYYRNILSSDDFVEALNIRNDNEENKFKLTAPGQYQGFSGTELLSILGMYDKINAMYKSGGLTELNGLAFLNTYNELWSKSSEAELNILTQLTDFSEEGLNEINEAIDNSQEFSSPELKARFKDAIAALFGYVPENINTAIENYTSKMATATEDYNKDLSSATKGMDYKAAAEMAKKLGVSVTDEYFDSKDGELFLKDTLLLYDHYFGENGITGSFKLKILDTLEKVNSWTNSLNHIKDNWDTMTTKLKLSVSSITGLTVNELSSLFSDFEKSGETDFIEYVKNYYTKLLEGIESSFKLYLKSAALKLAKESGKAKDLAEAMNKTTNKYVDGIIETKLKEALKTGNFEYFTKGAGANLITEEAKTIFPELMTSQLEAQKSVLNSLIDSTESGLQYIEANIYNRDLLLEMDKAGLAQLNKRGDEVLGATLDNSIENIDQIYDFINNYIAPLGLKAWREKRALLNQQKYELTKSSTFTDIMKEYNNIGEVMFAEFADAWKDTDISGIFQQQADGSYKANLPKLALFARDHMSELDELAQLQTEETLTKAIDDGMTSITSASDYVTKGTTKYSDMTTFVKLFNEALPGALATIQDLFGYDKDAQGYILDPLKYRDYLAGLKQMLQVMGASTEYIDGLILNANLSIYDAIDIKSFLDAENRSIGGEAREKLTKSLMNAGIWDSAYGKYKSENALDYIEAASRVLENASYVGVEMTPEELANKMAKDLKDINDSIRRKAAELMIQTIENGGIEAVNAMQAIATLQGKELTSADIESAYRAQVALIEKASELLTLGVGSVVSGDAIKMLELANYGLSLLGTSGSAVITSIGDISVAYLAYYTELLSSNEATIQALNDAKAKVYETKDGRAAEQKAIDLLGDAAGMTYSTFGQLLSDLGILMTDELMNTFESSGIIESMGGAKMRIKNFAAFARAMNWDFNSEEYISAFKSYNDGLIERNKKAKESIADEIDGLKDIKPGDQLNLTEFYSSLLTEAGQQIFSNLLKGLIQYGGLLVDGILSLSEDANLLGIAETLKSAALESGSTMTDQLSDMVLSIIDSYTDAITKGIEGGMTNLEKADLIKKGSDIGITHKESDFYLTADGWQMSTLAGMAYYNTMTLVDMRSRKKIYNSLSKTLKETNNNYKTTASMLSRIGELTRELNELNLNGVKTGDSKKKLLEDEINLLNEMYANSLSHKDDSWDFLSLNPYPEGMENALTFWKNVANLDYSMSQWSMSGTIDDVDRFTAGLALAQSMSEALGHAVQYAGMMIGDADIGGNFTLNDWLSGYTDYTSYDPSTGKTTSSVAVLSKLLGLYGFNLGKGGLDEASVQELAERNAKIMETFEAFGESMTGLQNTLLDYSSDSFGHDFQAFLDDEGNFMSDKFLALMQKNTKNYDKFMKFAEKVEINNSTLKDILTSGDKIDKNNTNIKALEGLFNAALDEGIDLATSYQAVSEILSSNGFEGVIKLFDTTYDIKGGRALVGDKNGKWTGPDGKVYDSAAKAWDAYNKLDLETLLQLIEASTGKSLADNTITVDGQEYTIDFVNGEVVYSKDGKKVGTASSPEGVLTNLYLDYVDGLTEGETKLSRPAWEIKTKIRTVPTIESLDGTLTSQLRSALQEAGITTKQQLQDAWGKTKESHFEFEATYGFSLEPEEGLEINWDSIEKQLLFDDIAASVLKGITEAFTGEGSKSLQEAIGSSLASAFTAEGIDVPKITLNPESIDVATGEIKPQAVLDYTVKGGKVTIVPESIEIEEPKGTSKKSENGQVSTTPEGMGTNKILKDKVVNPPEALGYVASAGISDVGSRKANDILDSIPQGQADAVQEFTTKLKIEQEIIPAESELPETLTLTIQQEIETVETPEVQDENADVNYDIGTVEKLPEQSADGTINWSNNYSIPTGLTASGTITWKNNWSKPVASAAGNVGLAHAKSTLMGELGPEMVVSNGRYFVVGQNGPEFVDLADDAIVFNHLLTQSLLEKGASTTRGLAITNERKAVAYAHGNINGGPAHGWADWTSQWRYGNTTWRGGANWISGHGSGNGADDTALEGYLKNLEKWYNLLQEIAKLEEKITYQEQLRAKISSDLTKNGKAYYESLKKSLEDISKLIQNLQTIVLQKEIERDTRIKELSGTLFDDMYDLDKDGLLKENESFRAEFDKMFKGNDNGAPPATTQELYEWLKKRYGEEAVKWDSNGKEIKFTGEAEKDLANYRTAVEAAIKRMEDLQSEIQGLTDDINEKSLDILAKEEERNEILAEMRDNQIDIEEQVLNAVVEIRERAIEEMENERDLYQDLADKMIEGLTQTLNNERAMYDMQSDLEETDKMRRRLAILQSSGGSASEIIDLQELIRLRDKDMYFDQALRQIDAIQLASDKEIERLDELIALDKEVLEYLKAHGLLWNDVYTLMVKSPTEIATFIQLNTEEYWNKSPVSSAKSMDELLFKTEQWAKYRDDTSTTFSEMLKSLLLNNGILQWKEASASLKTTFGEYFDKYNVNGELEQIYLKKYEETSDPVEATKAVRDEINRKKAEEEAAAKKHASPKKGGDSGGGGGGGSGGGHVHNKNGPMKNVSGWMHYTCTCGKDMGKAWQVYGAWKADQKGKAIGNAFAKGTLLGELGPEAWIANGKFHIAGQYGAEMVNLPNDAIVFNHLQTARLLQTGKAGRGNAVNGEDAVLGNKERNSYISTFWNLVARNRASMESINYPSYATSSSLEHISNELQNNNNTNEAITIEHAEVNMNVEQLANDYDAKRAGELALQEMLRIARKGSVTTVRR